MYKIGDFSQLAQVTVRTLRHYDQLGLLKPGHIDKFTNYRYYTVEQLPQLNRILALRDLGFALDEIGQMVERELTVDEMRTLLTQKQVEIEEQLRTESARLRRVANRLQQLERMGERSPYDVIVKSVPAVTLLSIRKTVPQVEQMSEYRGQLWNELYGWLDGMQIRPGEEFVVYHNTSYTGTNIGMSVGAVGMADTVLTGDPPRGGQLLNLVAAPQAASIVHNGPIYDIPRLVSALYGWLGMNGYASAGPYREIHLFGREMATLGGCSDEEVAACNLIYEVLVPIERF